MRKSPSRHAVKRNGKIYYRGKGANTKKAGAGKEIESRKKHAEKMKWHPDQYGSDEPESEVTVDDLQTKNTGMWKNLKAGQTIGYKTLGGRTENVKVHGWGKESGGKGRRELHVSNKRGHLRIDPMTSGDSIVDAVKEKSNKKKHSLSIPKEKRAGIMKSLKVKGDTNEPEYIPGKGKTNVREHLRKQRPRGKRAYKGPKY